MKKLMMMAMMVVASATAFAGDSDAFKAFKKAFKGLGYAEAETLVKNSVGQFANAQEKATAYNMLVELALDDFNKQSTIVTENQLAKQMGKEEKPVDNKLMSDMAYNALNYAIECDKYDQMPNEKGKISPKFAEKNAQRLWIQARNQLVNAGQEAAQANDEENALKYWGMFMDSNDAKLFANQDRTGQADFFGQVAYFAGNYAHKAGQLDRAKRYFSACSKDEKVDEQYKKAAHVNVLNMMKEGLKDKADTLRVVDEFKQMYSQAPDDDLLMDVMFNLYGDLKDKASQEDLLNKALAHNPNSFIALADKGLMYMSDNKASEAAECLKKASEVQPTNAVILHYLGMCLNAKASELAETNPSESKNVFKQAVEVYDKCKELDPDMLQVKWGYNRYQSYYNFYGADAPETKQAEAESK